MRYGYWLPVFGGWLRNVDDEAHGGVVGLRAAPRAAQRGDRLRPHAHRRAVAQRHQGDRRAVARRVVDGGGARRGHRAARAHGRGAAVVPSAGDSRQAGGEHRSHLERTARAQRRVGVVEGRGAPLRRGVRRARRSLRAHDASGSTSSTARGASRRSATTAGSTITTTSCSSRSRCRGRVVRGRRSTPAASRRRRRRLIARQCDAYVMHGDPPERIAPKIADMRRRREQASEALGVDLPPMQFGVAAYAIVRDSEAEAQERDRADHERHRGLAGLRELSRLDREHEARAAGEPAGLLGVEPRTARRVSSARRSRSPSASASSRTRASICCFSSAARSSRRWSASPTR